MFWLARAGNQETEQNELLERLAPSAGLANGWTSDVWWAGGRRLIKIPIVSAAVPTVARTRVEVTTAFGLGQSRAELRGARAVQRSASGSSRDPLRGVHERLQTLREIYVPKGF
jgi:hypothetical protein